MTQDEWEQAKQDVTDAMLTHTRPFRTPLYQELRTGPALAGSASYVELNGARVILTCEHVIALAPLSFSFHGAKEVYQHKGPWIDDPYPVDIGFAPVVDTVWNKTRHNASAIPYRRFAKKHSLSDPAEIIFFSGYAGENAHYGFGVYEAHATGYGSQEKQAAGDETIFEVFWEPLKTQFTSSTSAAARDEIKYDDAQGFSGSLVWNTRYLETIGLGRPWSPEDAVVTGLLRRWDTATKSLLVYRVEHVRAWLDRS